MTRYRKKPVVIEAVLWSGDTRTGEEATWLIEALQAGTIEERRDAKQLLIHTLEGTMTADIGDYVIQGVKGELYPCKPDIFEATYEATE